MGNTNVVDRIPSRIGLEEFEIFETDDLPAPAGGFHTLPQGLYLIKADVSFSNSLRCAAGARVTLVAVGQGPMLTYTGTAAMLTSEDNTALSFTINNVGLELTGNGATLLNTDGPGVFFDRSRIVFSGTNQGLGAVVNPSTFFSFRSLALSGYVAGITLVGVPLFVMSDVSLMSASAGAMTHFDIDSTSQIVQLDQVSFTADPTDILFDIDAGFSGFATLSHISNLGGSVFFAPGGQNETTPGVDVQDSPPQKNSFRVGSYTVADNTAETVINTIDIWEDLNLNGLAAVGSNLERWQLNSTTTGQLEYVGLAPLSIKGLAAMSVVSVGGSQEFEFRFCKNGAPLPDGIIQAIDLANALHPVGLLAPITVVNGDTINVQVRNRSGTSNIIIQNISVDVS